MKMNLLLNLIFIALMSYSQLIEAVEQTTSPDDAAVYFITPKDGDIVSGKVSVQFGLKGMGVAPAGVDKPNTGHHHLLIDVDKIPEKGIPMGTNVMHFGGGQTETTLNLDKGIHTLQLILGDKYHIPHFPKVVSKKITITVK